MSQTRGNSLRRALVLASALIVVRQPSPVATLISGATPPDAPGDPHQPPTLEEIRVLIKEDRYADAEASARELLRDAESRHGADSLEAAEVIDVLVEVLWRNKKTRDHEDRTLAERAVHIKEKALGRDDPQIATSVRGLANFLLTAGDYARAGPLYERALRIREAGLGPNHPDTAQSLDDLAWLLNENGNYTRALPLCERALAIREAAFGPDHEAVAESVSHLAVMVETNGDHTRARSLYERSIRLFERAFGPDDRRVAAPLFNLAGMLREDGDYGEARRLQERCLAIEERTFGSEHPDVALELVALGAVQQLAGDFAEARPLYERALAIQEKNLGPDHPDVAWTLTMLGQVLHEGFGNYTDAEKMYSRALTIDASTRGPEHDNVGWNLINLANLYRDTGRYEDARPLYKRGLAIREKTHGPESQVVAWCLGHYGRMLLLAGDSAAARRIYQRALSIYEKVHGRDSPRAAWVMAGLAEALWAGGEPGEALRVSLRAEEIGREHLRLTSHTLSEREALSYATDRPSALGMAISIVTGTQRHPSVREVFDALVRSRALVLDEIASRHQQATEISRRAREVIAASEHLARLLVRGMSESPPANFRQMLEEARRKKDRAERELGEAGVAPSLGLGRSPPGLTEVSQAVPGKSVLVSFARYDRYQRATVLTSPAPARPADGSAVSATPPWTLVPSYAAFVLRGGGKSPVAVTMGPAAEIDRLVLRWRAEMIRPADPSGRLMEGPEDAHRPAGEVLRHAIWDPIAPHLSGAERVFVVPDGALHLVSLAALPAGGDAFLVETGPLIHYLSAERDLIAAGTMTARRGRGLLALGNPAFDDRALFAALDSGGKGGSEPERSGAKIESRSHGRISACGNFRTMRFESLQGAGREAEEIAALWNRTPDGGEREDGTRSGAGGIEPQGVLLTGPAATEAALKASAPGRRVLHLATHGFFLGGRCPSALEGSRGIGGLSPARPSADVAGPGENPLQLSGLALAGANHRAAAALGEEDGVLTAEEVAAMDLSGLEWAVLSACDTGTGEVKAWEGVFGLRRAFQVAGARTLIMSLWQVADEPAREWMKVLYEARLSGHLETAVAVRQASLQVLRQRRERSLSTHPFYWAGFVAAGDWR